MEDSGLTPSEHGSSAAAACKPTRVRLSRAKGWRKPPDTVKVDRTTFWGNPFVVGRDGTRAECVDLYAKLMRGLLCLTSKATVDDQKAARKYIFANLTTIKGKHLACWCSLDGPCHADVLLTLANNYPRESGSSRSAVSDGVNT